ncbi:MAG: radical SAM protein [Cyanobacteria bacterium J06638_20]
MQSSTLSPSDADFKVVYGPVTSWRYGRSLGIDPIGSVSTCSFDCVYCQLGAIEQHISDRHIFIPTDRIRTDLAAAAPWDVDVVTLSGSGEPTLALNLGEILTLIREMTHRPSVVLTNGTLLGESAVQDALILADCVSMKLDAVTPDQLRRVNRSTPNFTLEQLVEGMRQFRDRFPNRLDIQTMILAPWSAEEEAVYAEIVRSLHPNEIQLNTPTRPKPLKHELEARGNHQPEERSYPVRSLKPLSQDALQAMGDRLQQATGIPVRSPYSSQNLQEAG